MSDLQLNRDEAERYLNLLDPTATGFCFWAGHDKDDNAKPWQRYGTLADRWADIERLNRLGYGIFVTVNTTDATGRRQARNITATRAIWHEDDEGYTGAFPIAPHFTVRSSPGKSHRYWLVDGLTENEHAGLLDVMCERFHGDNGAKGINRVLRLPGTWHQKGTPHPVKIVDVNEDAIAWGHYDRAELIQKFGPLPERRTAVPGPVSDSNPAEAEHIAAALACVDASEYGQWLAIGMALHHHYAGGEAGFTLWDDWSRGALSYDADATRAKWDSFDSERNGAVTIGTLYHAASASGFAGGAWRDTSGDVDDFPAVPAELRLALPAQPVVEAPLMDFDAWGEAWPDEEETDALPAFKRILSRYATRGFVSCLVAPGSVGKSLLALQMAAAVATGQGEFIGMEVLEQTRVMVINAEDTAQMMKMRAGAIFKHFKKTGALTGEDWQTVKKNVTLCSGLDREFRILKRGERQALIQNEADIQKLIARINREQVGLLIIDPLVDTHDADENSNAEMARVMTIYRRVCKETNCALLIIHHTRKPSSANAEGFAGSADSARGAGAVINAARAAFTLFSMTPKDAELYGKITERNRYVRLDDAKMNLSLASADASWYRKETVTLPNGEQTGVLVPAVLTDVSEMNAREEFELSLDLVPFGEADAITFSGLCKALVQSKLYKGLTTAKAEKLVLAAFSGSVRIPYEDCDVYFSPTDSGRGGTIWKDAKH
jgi:hypothetical protein